MLQWMGGSRRKVTTSRKSMQKRQKQYFEQRKRQQQYQQQTVRLESSDDRMDTSAPHNKEHRSLDIISLLTLSTIAQECKSACPGRKDLGVNASKMEFDITNHSPIILDTVVPANFVEFKETRTPSGFQVNTASQNKIASSVPDSHKNAVSGVNSKPDQWNTTAEQPLSVLDLLYDDGPSSNKEENRVHEAHVAFSVEGLGKVGTETPVHSPEQPNRTFSYGFSSSPKAAGMMKVSKNFNSSLDDIESEMDAEMQDIDLLHDSNPFKFSSDIIDSLSSPKQRSFTVREARDDGYNSKKNSHFSHHNDNEWDDRTTFQYPSFFDEREPDISWKTWQSRNDDNAADNLIYRDYVMSDFAFDGPRKPTRTSWKVTDKFDVLGSTFSFSKNETSEYDSDFLISNQARTSWKVTDKFDVLGSTFSFSKNETSEYDSDFLISNQARYPTVERKYDFKPETSKPDCFSFMTEDARDNSSLQSEESCSSSAVRYQGSDTSPSNLISRQGRIRGQGGGFSSSSDKYGVEKAFAKESKDDVQQKDIASGIAKQPNMLKSSESKPWHHASSFSREKLETRSIWYFEEGHTAVDISPGSRCFNQNPGAKNTIFDSEFWGEDPFSKFPTPKSRIGVDPLGDGFDSEPVAYSPSNCFTSKKNPLNDFSTISKLDFPPDSQLRNGPQVSPYTAGFQGETLSPDLSAQESFSKDDEKVNMKLSDFCDSFEPGEEICIRNEGLVSKEKAAVEASHSKNDNEREPREARGAVLPQMERVTTTVFPKPVEETLLSPSVDITDKSGSIKDESRDHHNDKSPFHQNGRKGSPLHQNGRKENIEDFGPKGRTGGKQKGDYVDSSCEAMMLQTYVFQFFCVHKRLKH